MVTSDASTSTNTSGRIGLWFGSLLVSVTLFSLFLSLFFFGVESVFIVFRTAMMFAFPVWCLYLPFVIALKDAESRRIWTILISGILIGPVSLALCGLIFLQRGEDAHRIWYGDPLLCGLGGIGAGMVFALIVGCLTTSFYVFALKHRHRRPAAAQGRVWRGAI